MMKRFNYRFVLSSVGLLLVIEALFMLFSALVGEQYHERATASIYLSALITFASGAILTFTGRKRRRSTAPNSLTRREVYLTVTLSWLTVALFGTLPYLLSGAIYSFTNAFFESICGFTTTGSSTLVNIEAFPRSLHFWRSITQWIGGIGIIIFVLSFMPVFGGISGQVYEAEVTGIAEEQFRPRISEITRQMSLTYLGLTLVGFIFLLAGPMDAFDAACHTLTAISTGGFSTRQMSIAYFSSPYTEYVITLLMFLGGTNFLLISTLVTRFKGTLFRDEEFRWYLLIILLFTAGITASLLFSGRMQGVESTFRTVLFQVIAAVTTTGFATADFQVWGSAYWLLFLVLILFCGSEGSTSGGMKISRLIALSKNTLLVFKRQVHPNALYVVKMNRKTVTGDTLSRLSAFVFLYVTLTVVSAAILGLTGMNFEESISVSLSSISNYGFGLGSYGPGGTFESATPFMKYYLSFLMLIGRLEIFTVLSLLIPGFWKR
ncbi:MAG: TrkH family potassium uptake protein [Proteiniphilum sp.]|jgi:trk system potassium uptake protein TrkH|nr:TrkH family potassium uptake protein [Proteiniphilum sp.]